MDINLAQKAILEVLISITPRNARSGQLEYQLLTDKENHHYQLLVSGWQQHKRVHGIVVQMDIRDGLIWVQEDGTDIGVSNELMRLGISENKIVLAYMMQNQTQNLEFARR
jgi:uncharacterized SAM-binding protein YcdF (DUF218 family)